MFYVYLFIFLITIVVWFLNIKYRFICIATFIFLIVVIVSIRLIFEKIIVNDIVVFIDKSTNNGYSVYKNNIEIKGDKEFIKEIFNFKDIRYHNSSPNLNNKITIYLVQDLDSIELSLYRDSQILNEYWVYYPKYKTSRDNEIGKLKTSLLNEYNNDTILVKASSRNK